jgi:hypothetical protein
MKPVLTKRMLADGIGRVRRGAHLIRWLESSDAPISASAPPPGTSGPIDWQSWLLWLQVKRELIPAELRPVEGEEAMDARVLAKLWAGARMRPPSQAWLVDCVRVPVMFIARDAGRGKLPRGLLEELMSGRATTLDCCLWAFAFWGAFMKCTRHDAGLIDALWQDSRNDLIDRLTIDEVWLARKRLLERMN